MTYVNAYEVERCYGGPEEGGWWYDAGIVRGTVEVPSDRTEDIEAAKAKLRRQFAPEYAGNKSRSSVIGGPDLEVWAEDEPAKDFPSERPHYE